MPIGSPFGPGIVALVGYLHACHFVSYNRLFATCPTRANAIKLKAVMADCRPSCSLCAAPHNRKVTNGFRSAWGADVYADICSIVATGRLNGRTALAAITQALAAGAAAAAVS